MRLVTAPASSKCAEDSAVWSKRGTNAMFLAKISVAAACHVRFQLSLIAHSHTEVFTKDYNGHFSKILVLLLVMRRHMSGTEMYRMKIRSANDIEAKCEKINCGF